MASLTLYRSLLQWTLIPIVLLFILSLTCVGLTTFYWVAGDWLITRGIVLDPGSARTLNVDWTTTIVDYVSNSTDAAVISACLGGLAAVISFLAWHKLRTDTIDTDYALPRRRLWVGLSLIVLGASLGSALACLIVHFTSKGPDAYGCTTTFNGPDSSHKDRWIMCTREMAYCNAIPMLKNIVDDDKEGAARRLADDVRNQTGVDVGVDGALNDGMELKGLKLIPHVCRITQAVKWMQILFIVCSATAAILIVTQSWLRRKTRYERVRIKKGKNVAEGVREPEVRHVLGET